MSGYYDDLSGCSSHGEDSDSEDEEEMATRDSSPEKMSRRRCASSSPNQRQESSTSRCILHVDVDCFYCQCEMVDRSLPEDRPFAIGQKHIIVTCNYAARRLGVKKLELREKAHAKCPNLIIFEGSDLTRYRIHARKIYESFRNACKQVCAYLPVAKGSMDEMMADLTLACQLDSSKSQKCVDAKAKAKKFHGPQQTTVHRLDSTKSLDLNESDVYVYGDHGQEHTILTEDQTGDSVEVVENISRNFAGSDNAVTARLQQAAFLAVHIRNSILQETGFRVTMGVSTNPLLAKLASGIKKPGIVNLLYPWRSKGLLENLPLRKLHGAGRRTLQVLHPCLTKHFPGRREPVVWTCRDLRAVPDHEIALCLRQLPSREPSDDQARKLLLKCRGIDDTPVEDDLGGLPKTVSVENSFRRGTVVTRTAVMDAVNDVCNRLPDLLRERSSISNNPMLAYPTTLRLTVRLVIDPRESTKPQHGRRRRPFETFSKQANFQGKRLLDMEESEKSKFLYQSISDMLRVLVFDKASFDVTRLNLAATNFCDLDSGSGTFLSSPPKQNIMSQSKLVANKQSTQGDEGPKRAATNVAKQFPKTQMREVTLQASEVDPAVLEELPAHIRSQILRSFHATSPRKKMRIDDFFKPIKRSSGSKK